MRKKLFSFVWVALAIFTIASCGKKSDPKDVAKNFLENLKNMDYENAKKFGTPETGKMLEMLASFSSMVPDSMKNEAKKEKVEIKDAKEDGDKCTVTFTSSKAPEKEEKINLVKKDGKWLVNMTKDDMGGGDAGAAPAEEASAVPAEEAAPADSAAVAEPATK